MNEKVKNEDKRDSSNQKKSKQNQKTVQSFSQTEFREWWDSINESKNGEKQLKNYNIIYFADTYDNFIRVPDNALVIKANDVDEDQITLFEKLIYKLPWFIIDLYKNHQKKNNPYYGQPFLSEHAQSIFDYINLKKPIVVECPEGDSRSVALACYFKDKHGYKYINEDNNYEKNYRVYNVLNKND